MEQQERKRSRFGVAARILALALALVMLLSLIFSSLTRVEQPESGTLTEKTVHDAFDALSRDDDYLSASANARVRMLLAQVEGGAKSAEDYERLASICVGRGEYGEAAVLYQSCIDATDSEAAALLANRYLKLASAEVLDNELEQAAADYRRALGYDPSLLYARLLLAQVYIETKDYDGAAEQLRGYVSRVPGDTDNRRLLASLEEYGGDHRSAYRQYALVYQETGAPEDCLSYARGAAMLGEDEKAIELYTRYLQEAEDADGSGHYLRGISLLRSGDYESARADLLSAVELGFSDPASCYAYMTVCTYYLADFEATIGYGEQALALARTPDGECLQRMGLAAMQLGRYPEARDYLSRSLEATPGLAENHYFLASICLLEADYENARAELDLAIDSGYLLQQCYYDRAICSLQLGDYAAAAEDLQSCMTAGEDEELTASAGELLSQLLADNAG